MAKLKLGTRFTLLLAILFAAGITVSGVALWQILQRRAQREISSQGALLIETISSLRAYTDRDVGPLLRDEATFVAQTVPAFAARQVFTELSQQQPYADLIYKEAAPNPRLEADRADDFERDLVAQLQRQPAAGELTGFRDLAGERVFYIARPLAVTAGGCLLCHDDPQDAPAGLVAQYGTENGFGWQLGEIVAAQIVYVPAQEVLDSTRNAFVGLMGLTVVVLALVILLVNFLLRHDVIAPVGVLGALATRIGGEELTPADLDSPALAAIVSRADELGQLARTVQAAGREVQARVARLQNQVQKLTIEISHRRREAEVAEVVESEFFQSLRSRADELRRRPDKEADDSPADEERDPETR